MEAHDLYRRSRRCEITCLSFGADRKQEHPDHFFCNGCDLLEDAVLNSGRRRRVNRESNKRFKCTGGHTDLANPTSLKKVYRPNQIRGIPPSEPLKTGAAAAPYSSSVVINNAGCAPSGKRVGRAIRIREQEVQEARVEHRMIQDHQSVASHGHADAASTTTVMMSASGKAAELSNEHGNSPHTSAFVTPGAATNHFFSDARRLFAGDNTPAVNACSCSPISRISTRPTAGSDDSATSHHGLSIEIAILRQRMNELTEVNKRLQDRVLLLTRENEALLLRIGQEEGLEHVIAGAPRGEEEEEGREDGTVPMSNAEEQQGRALLVETKAAPRRHRVSKENRELTDKLSRTIEAFVTSGELADRRKYPERRLSKIIVDSVASFEWIHAELSKFDGKQRVVAGIDGQDSAGWSVTEKLKSKLLALLSRIREGPGRSRGDKSKASLLVQCMWDEDFLNGEVRARMIDQVRQYFRQHVFSPWKILKALDIAGFKLSLAGIEVLRNVEVASRYGRAMLPSKSTILRCARQLEAAAIDFCPFKMIGRTFEEGGDDGSEVEGDSRSIVGEGFEFDTVKVTQTLFKAFGLMNEAKHRSVELGLASDGAQLTNTVTHVMAGLKFYDVAMRDPLTKLLMLLHSPDSLVQSRNLCFPLRIVIAKDGKMTLYGFRPLYDSFNNGSVSQAMECREFKMTFMGDMKMQWAALDKGGAAKVKDMFCYICPCRSASIHVPQDKGKCLLCTNRAAAAVGMMEHEEDDEDIANECYHHAFFADPGVRATLNEELDILTTILTEEGQTVAGLVGQQGMYVRRQGELPIEGDLLDIDCQPVTTPDKAAWAARITAELSARSMPTSGLLQERKERLKNVLLNEQRAHDLAAMLRESQPKDQAMYLVLQAVPCILHLENRVGLKSIESVLRSGLSNAQKGILDWTTAMGIQARQDQYVQRISSIIGCNILGTAIAPAQWRFPLAEDGSMGTLSMDTNRTRAVMNSMERLVDASFPTDSVDRKRLLRCFPKYRAAIILLRKKTDLDDDEIQTFQCLIDAWFNDWVRVYGKEGCTNYTHMLSSGHIMRYLEEWRCLHRFSQQGWEALNALIKSYFFRRTNRGGLSRHSTRKSKLLGIARWLQRRIMWYSGNGDAFFSGEGASDYESDDSSVEGSEGGGDECDTEAAADFIASDDGYDTDLSSVGSNK